MESACQGLRKGLDSMQVFFSLDVPYDNNGAHILTTNSYPGGKVLHLPSRDKQFSNKGVLPTHGSSHLYVNLSSSSPVEVAEHGMVTFL